MTRGRDDKIERSTERGLPITPVGSARQAVWRTICAHGPDIAGIATIIAIALLFVSPALKDGTSIGGFDIDTARLSPLGATLYPSVHNARMQDAVAQMIAWNAFDWRSIHSGAFPLWNSYSVLGMPEFLNFESSVLSLPDLVSYLAPLPAAFLVAVITKLVIAGCGTYAFARTLSLRVPSALLGGITFMLAGAISELTTNPQADVFAWMGWLCAGAIWAYRSPRRWSTVAFLAVVVAFFCYGGFPEANILVALVLAVVGLVWLLSKGRRLSVRGLARVGSASLIGVALAAPLWLPGAQVVSAGIRSNNLNYPLLSLDELRVVIAPGFDGLPVGISTGNHFYETVGYVGIFTVALTFVALTDRARRQIVTALGVALLLSLCLCYQIIPGDFVGHVASHLGPLANVRLSRLRGPIAFLVAVLCAIGFESLLTAPGRRSVRRSYVLGVVIVTAAVVDLVIDATTQRTRANATFSRLGATWWPIGLTVVAIAVAVVCLCLRSTLAGNKTLWWRRGLTVAVVGGQALFLFFAGVGIPSYNEGFYKQSPIETTLARIVGTKLVGLDTALPNADRRGDRAGFFPEVNIGYGISEFAAHDPVIPKAYYANWSGTQLSAPIGPGFFYPDIDTAAIARRYGVSYVLSAPENQRPPAGMVMVTKLGNETLYRVPGATRFSFTGPDATVVSSEQTGERSYGLVTTARRPTQLIARVTNEPGWHLTSDGTVLSLRPFDKVMLQATIPAGRQVLRLWYWPDRLSTGIDLAVAGAGLLGLWLVFTVIGTRRRRRASTGRGVPTWTPEAPRVSRIR